MAQSGLASSKRARRLTATTRGRKRKGASGDPGEDITPSFKSAMATVLRRLARRDHSEQEMRLLLAAKAISADDTDAIVSALRARGFLDDTRLAARYATSRLAHYGMGRHRIRATLLQRGLSREDAQQGLRAALTEIDEDEVLRRMARRYWAQHARVDPPIRLRRLQAFLLRRGFPSQRIYSLLAGLWPKHGEALLDADQDAVFEFEEN
ncbi:MAG: recombination regulator RecX [Vicinamibacteria bacterium]|nr:recombination regulator RecX [Vicinamibacteria bacterium]